MKIFIASDSYKGCMSSREANEHIKIGLLRADPGVKTSCFCISDGGEGFVEAYADAASARLHTAVTQDLYGKPVYARYAYHAQTRTVCVEAASVLGLMLYARPERHPMDASSFGLGLLCKNLMQTLPVSRLIIGLGGTGTNDGGMGFLAAFGAKFFDRSRHQIKPCAQNLAHIAFIDKREFRFPGNLELIAACDVSNPFLGPDGATSVFGKQKGLKPAQIAAVEKSMRWFCSKIDQTFHVDLNAHRGGGAAGGLGGMLGEVFGAKMISGIELLASSETMMKELDSADLIITGEGQTDDQSANGKAVARIGELAKQHGVPVVVISGALGSGCRKLYGCGVDAMFSTADRAMSFVYALSHGPEKLEQEAENIMRLINVAERIVKR